MNYEEIPQRELRNQVSKILASVQEAGVTYRVTVAGRAAADVVPIDPRPVWVNSRLIERIVREHPLDEEFAAEVGEIAGATIDEHFT